MKKTKKKVVKKKATKKVAKKAATKKKVAKKAKPKKKKLSADAVKKIEKATVMLKDLNDQIAADNAAELEGTDIEIPTAAIEDFESEDDSNDCSDTDDDEGYF